MSHDAWMIFLLMVFGTVFLLSQVFITSTFGENRHARRRIRARIAEVASEEDEKARSLLKQEYLESLSPLEAGVESLPGLDGLRRLLRQAGRRMPAYRVVMSGIGLAVVGGLAIWYMSGNPTMGIIGGLVCGPLPLLRLIQERSIRLERFEEQFPEALDTMARAMRAGHPYNLSLKFVSEELAPPVSEEFALMFSEVNYGGDHRRSLLNLLDRIPSVTVMAFVTAVLIQRDSGGNLTELLGKLSQTIRERFRFQRTIKTLSAQGRLSGWILALEPFALFAILWVTAPAYIQVLLTDPRGPWMIGVALGFTLIGIIWIRQIIRIDV